jgi:hypothetical protein
MLMTTLSIVARTQDHPAKKKTDRGLRLPDDARPIQQVWARAMGSPGTLENDESPTEYLPRSRQSIDLLG